MYRFSIFAATSVGEGPSADGSFLTREDSEFMNILAHYNYISDLWLCIVG